MKVQVVIPAGGLGARLGRPMPKALVPIAGVPLVVRTLRRFRAAGFVQRAIVAIPPTYRADFEAILQREFPEADIQLVDGGETRQDSVRNGVAALDPDTEICAVHDAARLFIAPETIVAAVEAARDVGAATVAIPSVDTILVEDGSHMLSDTPDRRLLWACQTPQVFQTALFRRAHAEALARGITVTDDATLVHRCGHPVRLVPGSPLNFKLTTPSDLLIAEALIEKGMECV